eukprot:764512-Ditylum_brightwellii.AAC.1
MQSRVTDENRNQQVRSIGTTHACVQMTANNSMVSTTMKHTPCCPIVHHSPLDDTIDPERMEIQTG